MRRSKKQGFVRVPYEFIQPEILARLQDQGIVVEFDNENALWTVHWPKGIRMESLGARVGIQLYDNSTCVTTYGKRALRLYATRPADPLHRPSFAEIDEAKARKQAK